MKEEILEGNKLIAEFMGKEIRGNWVILGGKYNSQYDICLLKYNSDWNELMAVIDKIEKLGWLIDIQKNECEILKSGWNIPMGFDGDTKIEATFFAVVEFIKWYNANKELTAINKEQA